MIIPDGRLQGKEAILIVGCDCVLIEGEIGFCVKDSRFIFSTDYDERDLRHIYDLLREKA